MINIETNSIFCHFDNTLRLCQNFSFKITHFQSKKANNWYDDNAINEDKHSLRRHWLAGNKSSRKGKDSVANSVGHFGYRVLFFLYYSQISSNPQYFSSSPVPRISRVSRIFFFLSFLDFSILSKTHYISPFFIFLRVRIMQFSAYLVFVVASFSCLPILLLLLLALSPCSRWPQIQHLPVGCPSLREKTFLPLGRYPPTAVLFLIPNHSHQSHAHPAFNSLLSRRTKPSATFWGYHNRYARTSLLPY